MVWFVKKRQQSAQLIPKLPSQQKVEKSIDFTFEVLNDDEKDCVSVIAASIMANNNPDSSFKVVSVREVDTDMEHCAIIASAIMAGDSLESRFKLVSIKERT